MWVCFLHTYRITKPERKFKKWQRLGRQILRRLMNEAPSQLIRALAGQLAMELSDNDSALNLLDEIGKTLKDNK